MKNIFLASIFSGVVLGLKANHPINQGIALVNYTTTNKLSQPKKNKINRTDRKGRKKGYWVFYYGESDGIKSCEGNYRRGWQINKWVYYNQTGSLEKTEKKLFLRRKYKTKLYHSNGLIKKEGYARLLVDHDYLFYYWTGNWKCYDETGKYTGTEKYIKGEIMNEDE